MWAFLLMDDPEIFKILIHSLKCTSPEELECAIQQLKYLRSIGVDIKNYFGVFKITGGKYHCKGNEFDKTAFWNNYMGTDYSEEEINCLLSANKTNLIKFLIENDVVSKCGSNETSKEIIDDLIDEMTVRGECTEGGLCKVLKNVAIYHLLTSKRILCVYNNYIKAEQNNNRILCATYDNFIGEDAPVLIFLEGDLNKEDAYALCEDLGDEINITIDSVPFVDKCEISIVAVLLHELIHAEMIRQLRSKGFNPETKDEIWNLWDSKLSDHENMAKSYIKTIAEALREIFGNRYTDKEYEAISWIGLNLDGMGEWDKLTEKEKKEINNTIEKMNKKCDHDKCK